MNIPPNTNVTARLADHPRQVRGVDFEPRNVPARPTMVAMMPPMSIQMALSVGDPVKNLDTSELNEFVALIPMTMSTTPRMSRARETILFITVLQMCELI